MMLLVPSKFSQPVLSRCISREKCHGGDAYSIFCCGSVVILEVAQPIPRF